MDDKRSIRFGTDGWRGVMCDDFVLAGVELVAQAVSEYVKSRGTPNPSIIIGHDTRFFAEQFASACARVAAGNGIRVLMPERAMPTPVIAFAIGAAGADGAIMLTASHNPAVYNGIKFIPHYGGPANPEITAQIEAILGGLAGEDIRRVTDESAVPEICEPIDGYRAQLERLVDFDALRAAKLPVVFDAMYGAGQGIMSDILSSAGCSVKSMHECRDAFFGGLMPEPTEANLTELRAAAAKDGAVGLALDGDADRFGVVDRTGALLSANQVLPILAVHLLRERAMRGRIVRTVATTHLLDVIAAAHGVESVETPVGFKYVANEMLAGDVLIGGEESGGLSIGGHVPEKDGLLADLLMCEVVARTGRSPIEALAAIHDEFGPRITRRIDVHYPSEAKADLLARLREQPPKSIGGLEIVEVRTIDGVKYLLERGAWVLVRPSGTEPVVRAYIEAENEADYEVLEKWTQQQLQTGA